MIGNSLSRHYRYRTAVGGQMVAGTLLPSALSLLLGSLLLAPCCGWAIDCPKQPEQAQKDSDVEVQAAVGKIGPVTGAELATRTRNVTHDLLGLLPQADKVYLEQMMYATYCSTLRDDPSLSEPQKSARIKAYNLEVRSALRAERGDAPPAPPRVSNQDAARADLARLSLPYTPEALVDSAQNGDSRAVKLFLASGMDPNAKDREGNTALMRAAGAGHLDTVQALLKGNAQVNETNAGGATALSWAAVHDRQEVVRLLLEHRVDRPALREAVVATAQAGNVDVLRILAKDGLDKPVINQALLSAAGSTIADASEAGINGVVQFLLSLGADVNARGDDSPEDGWTPLLTAADRDRVDVVRTLLEAGADSNARCVCRGYLDGGWTSLMIAALHGDQALLDLLLAHGADPNRANNDGGTALMLTARAQGESKNMGALLDAGADIQAKSAAGVTALMVAASSGRADLVETLLRRGARVGDKDENHKTALDYANNRLQGDDSADGRKILGLLKKARQ